MAISPKDTSSASESQTQRFYIKIKATVTTDKMEELAQRIKSKNVATDYKKLQEDYARLNREIEGWKQLITHTPYGLERSSALEQIREREKAFAVIQESEAAFFQRLMSGQTLARQALDNQAAVDRLVQTVTEQGHLITLGEVKANAVSGKQGYLQIIFPVRFKVSENLFTTIFESAKSLGGIVIPSNSLRVVTDEAASLFNDPPIMFNADSQIATVTLIRLADDPYIAKYFQDQLTELTFTFQLTGVSGNSAYCLLGACPTLMEEHHVLDR